VPFSIPKSYGSNDDYIVPTPEQLAAYVAYLESELAAASQALGVAQAMAARAPKTPHTTESAPPPPPPARPASKIAPAHAQKEARRRTPRRGTNMKVEEAARFLVEVLRAQPDRTMLVRDLDDVMRTKYTVHYIYKAKRAAEKLGYRRVFPDTLGGPSKATLVDV
jgi:hypothetical protein